MALRKEMRMKGRKTSGKRIRLNSDSAVYTRAGLRLLPTRLNVPIAATPMSVGTLKSSRPKMAPSLEVAQMLATSCCRIASTRSRNDASHA